MIAEQNEINIKPSTKEMEYWAKQVVKTSQGKVQFGIMGANNHYAGFGPMTANTFRKMLGLKEVVWEAKKQQSLSDF